MKLSLFLFLFILLNVIFYTAFAEAMIEATEIETSIETPAISDANLFIDFKLKINLQTIDDKETIFKDATLQCNLNPEIIHQGVFERQLRTLHTRPQHSDSIIFSRAEPGSYTLIINSENYNQYIDEAFVFDRKTSYYPVVLIPDGHSGFQYTILNNTSLAITSIYSKQVNLWQPVNLDSEILTSKSHTVNLRYVNMERSLELRIIDIEGNVYTKYDLPTEIGTTVTFTDDDIDGEAIKPLGINDFQRFDFSAHFRDGYILIYTPRDSLSPELHIDNVNKPLKRGMPVNGLNTWSTPFKHIHGETYQINFKEPKLEINETIYFTIPQSLILKFPDSITDKQVDIGWNYIPDNEINSNFLLLQIYYFNLNYRRRERGSTSWNHREYLCPDQRNYTTVLTEIADDTVFILKPSETISYHTLKIELSSINYAYSGRVFLYCNKNDEIMYYVKD